MKYIINYIGKLLFLILLIENYFNLFCNGHKRRNPKRDKHLLLYQALFMPELLKNPEIQIETSSVESILNAESPPIAQIDVEQEYAASEDNVKIQHTGHSGGGGGGGGGGDVETTTIPRSANDLQSFEALCQGVDGSIGMCTTRNQCDKLEGINQGNCLRKGFICCKVQKSCHNSTKAEISYFINPHFPLDNDQASFCDYRIDVINADVCQLRLDFEKFSLRGPHKVFGVCRKDRFMVTTSFPHGIGISDLCGENTGQHIYVNVNPGSSVSLMIMTSGGASYMWKIKVTQIDCRKDSVIVAPQGCLQYYTELSGTIQSFNFIGKLYQANLDYAICIKRSLNTCRVEYHQDAGTDFGINSFEGTDLATNMGRSGTVSCDLISHDYIYIPGGMRDIQDVLDVELDEDEEKTVDDPVTFTTQEKFCGKSLSGFAVKEFADNLYMDEALNPPQNITPPSVVTSYASGPIILRFHSDKSTNKDTDIGFSITYQQLGTGCNRRT